MSKNRSLLLGFVFGLLGTEMSFSRPKFAKLSSAPDSERSNDEPQTTVVSKAISMPLYHTSLFMASLLLRWSASAPDGGGGCRLRNNAVNGVRAGSDRYP